MNPKQHIDNKIETLNTIREPTAVDADTVELAEGNR